MNSLGRLKVMLLLGGSTLLGSMAASNDGDDTKIRHVFPRSDQASAANAYDASSFDSGNVATAPIAAAERALSDLTCSRQAK